jgi:hypothetical protein
LTPIFSCFILGIQSTNRDLIDEDISTQTLRSDDQRTNLLKLIEQERYQSYDKQTDLFEGQILQSTVFDEDNQIST